MAANSTQNRNKSKADMKGLTAALLKGVRGSDSKREVKREDATLYTWKATVKRDGKDVTVRVAEVIRRRAVVRLNLLHTPAGDPFAGVATAERLDRGNRQGGVASHFKWGMQVDADTLEIANGLLKAAVAQAS